MAEDWKCAGCGKASPDRRRTCECATSVVRRAGMSAWKRGEGDDCNRVAELEKLLLDLLDAHRTGNLEMNSPEIGGPDDIPMQPWHETWLHLAEQAVNR